MKRAKVYIRIVGKKLLSWQQVKEAIYAYNNLLRDLLYESTGRSHIVLRFQLATQAS